MTVKDRLIKLSEEKFVVNHKALGDETLLDHDWARIRSKDWDFYHTCDIRNIDEIPEELLSKVVLDEEVWMCGGIMSLDLII